MNKKSIKYRFLLYSAIAIIIFSIFASTLLGVYLRKIYITNSKNEYINFSKETSFQVKNQIEKQIKIIEILSQNLSAVNNNQNNSHKEINNFIKETIYQNDEIIDLFILFEPEIIDINDSNNTNLDSINRCLLHYKKNRDGIINLKQEINSDYEFYYKTTRLKLEQIIFKPHKNNDELLLPLTYPITYGNVFIGLIGIEISLNQIFNEIKTIEYKNSEMLIINNKGIIISATTKPFYNGKLYTEYFLEKQKLIFSNLKNSTPFSEKYKNKYLFSTPIFIMNTDDSWQICIITDKKNILKKANFIFLLTIIGGILFSLIILLFLWLISDKIFAPIKIIEKQTELLTKGEVYYLHEEIENTKELSFISDNIQKLQNRLIRVIDLNKKMAKANYSERMRLEGDNDKIAFSINHAIDEIFKRKNIREIAEKNNQQNDWLNKGLSEINNVIQKKTNSIEELADIIIITLSKYVNAYLGGIFLYNDENKNDVFLENISTFAYENKKAVKRKIKIGEGLIGTIAQEKKLKYIENIPNNYQVITTGLGRTQPKSILILPLISENNLIGILELAFLNKTQKYVVDFITKVSETIASEFVSIITNKKRTELLEKSQLQAKELDNAHQLLQQNLKEAKLRQKEIKERENKLQSILNAVDNTIMTIEYTTDGILVDANKKFLEIMQFSLKELKGVNVLDLVKEEKEELQKIIKAVSKGEFYEKEMKRYTKYGEVKWLLSTYTPYYNIDGNITKILYFAYDITETKNYIEELERKLKIKN